MTTYNTRNPLGSTDPKDLYDNAQAFDRAVNDRENDFYTDRFGNQRQTLGGIERSGGIQGYATLTALQASPGQTVGQLAQVTNDGDKTGLYRWDGTKWVMSDAKYADFEAVKKSIGGVHRSPIQYIGDNVTVWTENGKLNSVGLTENLQEEAVKVITDKVVSSETVPLLALGDDVYAWMRADGVDFSGISESLGKKISEKLGFADKVLPMATDGRSLFRLKAKVGAMKSGLSKVSILFTGDSWTERNAIPERLAAYLNSIGVSTVADGFRCPRIAGTSYQTSIHTKTGWEGSIDGSSDTDFSHGAGIDGNGIYTTGDTSTYTITNLKARSLKLFYFSMAGTFRYRLDGGSWQIISTTSTSVTYSVLDINDLKGDSHTLEIDTQGNTGTVVLTGIYSTNNSVGVEINKCGNGGLTGTRLSLWTDFIGKPAAAINPDVVFVYLGTNDYRSTNSTPETYIAGLTALAEQYKSAIPDVGLVFVAPAKSNAAVHIPLINYVNALYEFCKSNGYEFLNLYDQFGSFEEANRLSLWADALHLNNNGANVNAQILNSTFLKI